MTGVDTNIADTCNDSHQPILYLTIVIILTEIIIILKIKYINM